MKAIKKEIRPFHRLGRVKNQILFANSKQVPNFFTFDREHSPNLQQNFDNRCKNTEDLSIAIKKLKTIKKHRLLNNQSDSPLCLKAVEWLKSKPIFQYDTDVSPRSPKKLHKSLIVNNPSIVHLGTNEPTFVSETSVISHPKYQKYQLKDQDFQQKKNQNLIKKRSNSENITGIKPIKELDSDQKSAQLILKAELNKSQIIQNNCHSEHNNDTTNPNKSFYKFLESSSFSRFEFVKKLMNSIRIEKEQQSKQVEAHKKNIQENIKDNSKGIRFKIIQNAKNKNMKRVFSNTSSLKILEDYDKSQVVIGKTVEKDNCNIDLKLPQPSYFRKYSEDNTTGVYYQPMYRKKSRNRKDRNEKVCSQVNEQRNRPEKSVNFDKQENVVRTSKYVYIDPSHYVKDRKDMTDIKKKIDLNKKVVLGHQSTFKLKKKITKSGLLNKALNKHTNNNEEQEILWTKNAYSMNNYNYGDRETLRKKSQENHENKFYTGLINQERFEELKGLAGKHIGGLYSETQAIKNIKEKFINIGKKFSSSQEPKSYDRVKSESPREDIQGLLQQKKENKESVDIFQGKFLKRIKKDINKGKDWRQYNKNIDWDQFLKINDEQLSTYEHTKIISGGNVKSQPLLRKKISMDRMPVIRKERDMSGEWLEGWNFDERSSGSDPNLLPEMDDIYEDEAEC